MLFPSNPKIVVIDDEKNAVEKLLETFEHEKMPYVYLTGEKDCVKKDDKKKYSGVRLIIFDIDLAGRTSAIDIKSTASADAVLISKIVSEGCPYFLFFWTQNPKLVDPILEILAKHNISPIDHHCETKPSKASMGKLTIEYFQSLINEKTNAPLFEYLVEWEHNVQVTAEKFVNEIGRIAWKEHSYNNADWQNSIKNLLSKMNCSYTGERKNLCDDKTALENATCILNNSLICSIPTKTSVSISDIPQESSLSLETIASFNSKLFFEKEIDQSVEYGKVFYEENNDLFELLKKDLLSKTKLGEASPKLIGLILTPPCDIAQQKYLSNRKPKDSDNFKAAHRVLYGLKFYISGNINDFLAYPSKSRKIREKINTCEAIPQDLKDVLGKSVPSNKPENIYVIEPFLDECDRVSAIVFHFGTLSSMIIKKENTLDFKLKLKENLTFDLQSKAANHVNRLGNSMLEY